MEKRYIVMYYIEDNVVYEEYFENKNDAIEAAKMFDCKAFHGVNPDEFSLYVEARDAETWDILIWLNTDGEMGSDFENIDVWDD